MQKMQKQVVRRAVPRCWSHCPAMFSKSFIVAGVVALLAAAAPVNGARVRFYTSRNNCAGSPSQDYQNVKCNSCIDPPGGTSFPPSPTSECCG